MGGKPTKINIRQEQLNKIEVCKREGFGGIILDAIWRTPIKWVNGLFNTELVDRANVNPLPPLVVVSYGMYTSSIYFWLTGQARLGILLDLMATLFMFRQMALSSIRCLELQDKVKRGRSELRKQAKSLDLAEKKQAETQLKKIKRHSNQAKKAARKG